MSTTSNDSRFDYDNLDYHLIANSAVIKDIFKEQIKSEFFRDHYKILFEEEIEKKPFIKKDDCKKLFEGFYEENKSNKWKSFWKHPLLPIIVSSIITFILGIVSAIFLPKILS